MPMEILDVDPRKLRVPPSRPTGADPYKLQTQIARFGSTQVGMPIIWVQRGSDGELLISNGVTRATRIAKMAPGTTVRVLVIGRLRKPAGRFPTIEDLLP
jgi:hypothetical protein